LSVVPGFSSPAWAVVRRKLEDRVKYGVPLDLPFIGDVTAGNRHIHGKMKVDPAYCSRFIFTDKEPRLKIAPDLLCEWRDLPRHFPRDFFGCTVFDPPFYYSNKCPYFLDPQENRHPRQGPFYGHVYSTKRKMLSELYYAQSALAEVSSRMCFKWGEINLSAERVLTLFDRWDVAFINSYKGYKNFRNGKCVWVKLVRRGFVAS